MSLSDFEQLPGRTEQAARTAPEGLHDRTLPGGRGRERKFLLPNPPTHAS
ncbi:MAG: hypothetical protein ACL93V_04535 [Candidatus Electrothrix sp. YB6]